MSVALKRNGQCSCHTLNVSFQSFTMLKTPKNICCGCGACQQACPVQCIELKPDKKGFLYPTVDKSRCIKCGKCERVCPALKENTYNNLPQIYAAKNGDLQKRLNSSSGGVFSMLAEKVIAEVKGDLPDLD